MSSTQNEDWKPCEDHGPEISALVDGELEAPDVLLAVDHLVICSHCRSFYYRARRLNEMIQASSASSEAPPEEIWRRIAADSGLDRVSSRRASSARWRVHHRAVRRWAPRLAALLMLGLGLWLARTLTLPEETQLEEPMLVTLEEDRGAMSDERFVSLAAEVLRADRRYHRKMLQVMQLAAAAGPRAEGAVDRADEEPWPLEAGDERISLGEDDHLREREGFVWRGQQL